MNKKRQVSLIHLMPLLSFHTLRTPFFLMFSGVIERTQPHQMGQDESFLENKTSVYGIPHQK